MGRVRYRVGDATDPQGRGPKVIAHSCNDRGGWGQGFVVAVSRRWPEPEAAYRRWYRERADNDFGLGAVQLVEVGPELWVANMIGQHGITTSRTKTPPVRYEALQQALRRLAEHARNLNASVHMPRIGCGLAGGEWSRIEPLIEAELADVTVYDLSPPAARPGPPALGRRPRGTSAPRPK